MLLRRREYQCDPNFADESNLEIQVNWLLCMWLDTGVRMDMLRRVQPGFFIPILIVVPADTIRTARSK